MNVNNNDIDAFIAELTTYTAPPNGDSRQGNLSPAIAAVVNDDDHWIHWDIPLNTNGVASPWALGVRLSTGRAKAILAIGDALITLDDENLVKFATVLATLLSIAGDEPGVMPGVDDIDPSSVGPTVMTTTTNGGNDEVAMFYIDDRDPDNPIIHDVDPEHRKYGLMLIEDNSDLASCLTLNPPAARALWHVAASAANLSLHLAKAANGDISHEKLFEIFDYIAPDNT